MVKIALIIVFIAGFGLMMFNPKGSSASYAQSADRFDKLFDRLVRSDFFAGMTGNVERLVRAMKNAEEVLAKNPKHAQALVWHGGGLLARASVAYRKGDNKIGDQLWEQGLKEMDEALTLSPDRIDVIIGRSAPIIGLAQSVGTRTTQQAGRCSKARCSVMKRFIGSKSRISVKSANTVAANCCSAWRAAGAFWANIKRHADTCGLL